MPEAVLVVAADLASHRRGGDSVRDRIALLLAAAGFGFYVALGSDLALASGTALLVFRFRDYLDGPPFCPRCGRGMRK